MSLYYDFVQILKHFFDQFVVLAVIMILKLVK